MKTAQSSRNKTKRELEIELGQLRARLVELETTQAAIGAGDVDAIVVQGPDGDRVFTLQDPANPYRILAEQMNEGSATLTPDGSILFCNRRMAEMLGRPVDRVIGGAFSSMLGGGEREGIAELLKNALAGDVRVERELLREDGALLPVRLSLSLVLFDNSDQVICMVATDLTELNRARHVLQQQAEVFELANDAIIIRGLNDEIRSWNRGATDIYGWSPEEAIGKVMPDLLRTEYLEPLEDIQSMFQKTNGWQGEVHQVSRDGKSLVIASRWSLLRGELGDPDSILVINRDVTEKSAAQAAMRESELRFRMLADLVPQFVWIAAPDGQNLFFNQRWSDYTGLTAEQSSAAGWSTPYHPDDTERVQQVWNHATATGESYRVEARIRRFDGSYRWFLMLALPSEEDGAIVRWFGTCTDIEDSKVAEAEMRDAQRELKLRQKIAQRFLEVRGKDVFTKVVDLIVDATHSREGLFGVIEADGAVVYPSGKASASARGDKAPTNGALANHQDEYWNEIWAQAMVQKRSIFSNRQIATSDGTPTLRRTMVVPILFHGELVGQLGVAGPPRDYTEEDKSFLERVAVNLAPLLRTRILWNCEEAARKQAEKDLRDLNRELDLRVQLRTSSLIDLNKELESFSYSVSHDLRAPLRHIDGFLTLLTKRCYSTLDESSQHYVDCALEAAQRMGRLIDDLLQFSRLGRSEMRRVNVNMTSMIQEVRRELEPEILDRKIVWNIEPLPDVAADPAMLRQVMHNLLGNAVKFTQRCPAPKIEIGSRPGDDQEIVFFVRDNGAGFDMRYYKKMFQVFQRLHGEKDFEGTGIGLAIVRRVVERQGGRVWAEGSVGAGATVYFALPSVNRSTVEGPHEVKTNLVG